jgi:hypothetical protein
MEMQELINQRRSKKVSFEFEIIDDDAIIINEQYYKMSLRDIFIFNPDYVYWLIEHSKMTDLKMVAKQIVEDYKRFEEGISSEIALH